MKTTGGFKLWQIIYPIGIYYVVSSLMYFVLGLFLGDGQQTYMLRQLICSAATIPATMSFYKQDKIAEQVVYGTEKEKLDTKWLTDTVLAVVGAATLGIAVNNIIAMTPLVQMSEGFQEANESFFIPRNRIYSSQVHSAMKSRSMYTGSMCSQHWTLRSG